MVIRAMRDKQNFDQRISSAFTHATRIPSAAYDDGTGQ
jgi:hypothetical protein